MILKLAKAFALANVSGWRFFYFDLGGPMCSTATTKQIFKLALTAVLLVSQASCTSLPAVTSPPAATPVAFIDDSSEYFQPAKRRPAGDIDYMKAILEADAGTKGSLPIVGDISKAKARLDKILEFARSEPGPFFKHMRATKPVLMSQGASLGSKKIPNIYLVTTHALVKEILDRHSEFSVRPYRAIMDPTVGAPFMLAHEDSPANNEKPLVRTTLDGIKNAARVRATVASLAQRAIRNGSHAGKIDIVRAVSRAVPLGLNQEYFGFDAQIEDLARWSRATQHAFFHNSNREEKVSSAALKSGEEMRQYIRKTLIPSRKKELSNGRPALDSVSLVLDLPFSQFHQSLGQSDERIVTNIIGFIVGSVETTSTAISQSLQYILSKPKVLKLALEAAQKDDDELMTKIVWEAQRFDPINPFVGRYVESDAILGKGTPNETYIEKGAYVLAATESAMFDESAFPNPEQFRLDRDPKTYMHLGGDYHRCLGDDVAWVMVPETIKQILKLKNIRAQGPIDQKSGPFPESFVISHDSFLSEDSANDKFKSNDEIIAALEMKDLATSVTAQNTGLEKKRQTEAQQAIAKLKNMMPTIWHGSRESKVSKTEEINQLVVDSLKNLTADQQQKLCFGRNPKVRALFPNDKDRGSFCQLPVAFRSCWISERFLLDRPSYSAYYHCSYGQNTLNEPERDLIRKDLKNTDDFYFVQFEGGRP
jgi:cytochrome P450